MMLTYLERRVRALEMISRDQMRSGSSSRRSEEISFLDKPGDLNLRTARRRQGVVQCADIWQILPRIGYLEISRDISHIIITISAFTVSCLDTHFYLSHQLVFLITT